jgi:uncharacterized protein (TIGR00251 family)
MARMKKFKLPSDVVEKIKKYIIQNDFVVNVKVIPKSNNDDIYFENGLLKIKIKEVPENGKANAAIIGLLANVLDIPQNDIIILKGGHSGNKVVNVRLSGFDFSGAEK